MVICVAITWQNSIFLFLWTLILNLRQVLKLMLEDESEVSLWLADFQKAIIWLAIEALEWHLAHINLKTLLSVSKITKIKTCPEMSLTKTVSIQTCPNPILVRTRTKPFLHISRNEILVLSLRIILSKISLSKTFLNKISLSKIFFNLAMSIDTHRIIPTLLGPNGTTSGPWILTLQVQVKDNLHWLLLGLIAIEGGRPLKPSTDPSCIFPSMSLLSQLHWINSDSWTWKISFTSKMFYSRVS